MKALYEQRINEGEVSKEEAVKTLAKKHLRKFSDCINIHKNVYL
jgi:hypothetical protein